MRNLIQALMVPKKPGVGSMRRWSKAFDSPGKSYGWEDNNVHI